MYNLAKKALDAHEKCCSVAICDRFCDCVTPNTKRLQINFIHILYEYSFIPRHVCSEIFLDPYSFRWAAIFLKNHNSNDLSTCESRWDLWTVQRKDIKDSNYFKKIINKFRDLYWMIIDVLLIQACGSWNEGTSKPDFFFCVQTINHWSW